MQHEREILSSRRKYVKGPIPVETAIARPQPPRDRSWIHRTGADQQNDDRAKIVKSRGSLGASFLAPARQRGSADRGELRKLHVPHAHLLGQSAELNRKRTDLLKLYQDIDCPLIQRRMLRRTLLGGLPS